MPSTLKPAQLRLMRLRAQCLTARRSSAALSDVVSALCGVNAQSLPAMQLALRARIHGLSVGDITYAIAHRRLVRTWTVRGTLHLLAARDVRWFVSLLGPVLNPQGRSRRLQLGLDDDIAARGLDTLRVILARKGPLTRKEIACELAASGLHLAPQSQAPIHLITYAAQAGALCLGPDRPNGDSTYVLMDKWVAQQKPRARAEALAELARRYLAGYGPATVRDFAAWSGLSLADASQGWDAARERNSWREYRLDDRSFFSVGTASLPRAFSHSQPLVHLLPAFDTYLLGYANRSHIVPPVHHADVYHGGQVVPVVLVDGLAAGVWRYVRHNNRLAISVRPFTSFDSTIRSLIAAEAEDIGRFWNTLVSLLFMRR